MKKLFAVLVVLAAICAQAFAQSPVRQSGNVTPRHAACWTTTGVIQDCGTAAVPFLTSLGTLGQGPTICANSALDNGNRLCLAANTSSAAQISLQNYGSASPQDLQLNINGNILTFPASLGGTLITGTAPFTVAHIPCFSSTTGTIVDCGLAASAGTITTGVWQGTPVGLLYGGTGSSTASGARTALGLGTIATQDASAVAITGGTITGMPTPSGATDVANKSYVDGLASGLHILAPSRLATAAVLPNSPTYDNGTLGVGATLTAGGNAAFAALTVDGTSVSAANVILVKNQAAAAQNGIYTVTTVGDDSTPWVLTRATYFDQAAEMLAGSYTNITAGATNTGQAYVLSTTVVTVGSSAVTFNLFSSGGITSIGGETGAVTLGNGLGISANVLNTTIAITNGNYYLNASTGDDANNCKAAVAGGGSGPCLTLQRGIDSAMATDANSTNATLNLATGTYNTSGTISGPIRGSGSSTVVASLVLNGTGSATTILDNAGANCWSLLVTGSANVLLQNLTIQKTASGCGALYVENGGYVATSTDVAFGVAGGANGEHMHIEARGIVEHTASYKITGNAIRHWGISTGGGAEIDGHTVTCSGVTAFQEFTNVSSNGWLLLLPGTAFSGCGSVTGQRYIIDTNGTITDSTATGPSLLPGSGPGLYSTGAVYDPAPVPTIGTCAGSNISSGSTDSAMQINFGGALSSCSIVFGLERGNPPVCVASNTLGSAMGISTTTLGFTIQGSFVLGESAYVICTGRPR